jgi:hypothetical protein
MTSKQNLSALPPKGKEKAPSFQPFNIPFDKINRTGKKLKSKR